MKRKILLVDDDFSIRRLLLRVFTEEQYEVLSAASGPEAIELANQSRVDLVLLDLKLAGQSGWEIFERLTRDIPALPVIIITALPDQMLQAIRSGARALMEKPLDIPLLLQTVENLLSRPRELCRAAQGVESQNAIGWNGQLARTVGLPASCVRHEVGWKTE